MSAPPKSFHRYLLADSRDRDWGIYATSAGYVDVAPGSPYPPAGHPKRYAFEWKEGRELDEFQVHFISRGEGVFDGAGRAARGLRVAPGSAFITFPQVWHRYAPLGQTGWLEYWIGFKGDYAARLLKRRFLTPARPVVALADPEPVHRLFAEAVGRLRHHPAGAPRLLGALAVRILAEISLGDGDRPGGANRTERIMGEAREMLGQHLDREFELEALAQKLNVGYHWLRRAFRRETGQSLHQYRLLVRINHAKALLRRGDETVERVAQQAGFGNPYYFSQIFKRKTGCTPSQWRRGSNP
jgi:AraC-like DNA-binding protein